MMVLGELTLQVVPALKSFENSQTGFPFVSSKLWFTSAFLAGFSLQSYFGLQKSSTIAGTGGQDSLTVGDTASLMPPKIEISGLDPKQVPPRPHKLKPRDMNVLTPSSF